MPNHYRRNTADNQENKKRKLRMIKMERMRKKTGITLQDLFNDPKLKSRGKDV